MIEFFITTLQFKKLKKGKKKIEISFLLFHYTAFATVQSLGCIINLFY